MKFVKWVSLFLVSIYLASVQVSALLDFPNLLNTGSSYEGGTLAPANTGSSFFQNLLKKINFGSSYTQTNNTQNTTTSATQNNTYSSGSTGNSSSYSPSTVQTTSYDAEYQKILKQNLGLSRMSGSGSAVFAQYPESLRECSVQHDTLTEKVLRSLATPNELWTARTCRGLDEHPMQHWVQD